MPNTVMPTVRLHPVQAYQARFARWLTAAVLLHALLLLIPASRDLLPGPASTTFKVTLSRTWRAPAPAKPAQSGRRETTPAERRLARPGPPDTGSPPAATPPAEPPLPPADAGAQPGDTRAPVTTARLLDIAHRREWNLPEPPAAPRPGVFAPHAPPERQSGIPQSGAPAENRALPGSTMIVDQWLAADGSHNVMVRTSSGQVLCGRAEAWNPMSPLVEPVMMYRACGNGRRTFEMPERVLLR